MRSTSFDPAALQAGYDLDVDGTVTHYHDAGDGPAILLLHGSGPGVSAWANWRLVLPELARSFRVIAPDQLGFNKTQAPEGVRYGRRAWTGHALRLMETLGIDRFHVVGNSMGGAIALSMAAGSPERVGRLVVMGTMGIAMRLPPGLEEVWGYQPSPAAMRRMVELFAHDQSIATDELIETRYQASIAAGNQESFSAMFPPPRQQGVDDLALSPAELASVSHPVLLVHGYNDQVVPLAASSLPLMDVLADARLHVFGNCGHWVQIERTGPFNHLVASFLAPS
jgi:2-hydroxymuconate-semialdehyde hydrolase